MTRLNNDIREQIADSIIKHRYAEAAQKLKDEHIRTADLIYKELVGDDLDDMLALPDGWLPKQDHISVNLTGGVFGYFRFNYCAVEILGVKADDHTKRTQRVLKSKYASHHAILLNNKGVAFKAAKKIIDKIDSHNMEVTKIHNSIVSALSKVSSCKRLIEEWPEIESFVRPHMVPTKPEPKLPVISPKQLNKDLGLPPTAGETL